MVSECGICKLVVESVQNILKDNKTEVSARQAWGKVEGGREGGGEKGGQP